jgi:putative membrane protein
MELLSANETGGFITLFIINLLGGYFGTHFLKKSRFRIAKKGLIVALALAVLNVTLGAVLDFMTAPLRWLTLGSFSFIVEAIVILLASKLVRGFAVRGFWERLVWQL